MAARYIGGSKSSDIVSNLSKSTKTIASKIISDPNSMENIIGLVRTAAPLTSDKTISKINTYLPAFEKISTLIGLYSFLNRAQNFAPIQSLNAKTQAEKVSALIANSNIPIGKILAQPLITNNMDKIFSSYLKGAFKNGNINDILSSFTNLNTGGSKTDSASSDINLDNIDLKGLMDTFMPIMNNIMKSSSTADNDNHSFKESEIENNTLDNNHPSGDVHIDKEKKSGNEFNNTSSSKARQKSVKNEAPVKIRRRQRTSK